jgi:4-hydroxybenzoate polyprenyltransferase
MSELLSQEELERRLQPRMKPAWGDYLELLRLPNVFTAAADVAMGFLFVQPDYVRWRPTPWDWTALALLAAASCCLYLAGMALNDLFDVEFDRRERPERPLPSGRIPIESARRLAWRLLWIGVGLGTAACFVVGHLRPGIAVALLASAVVAYDARLKRTPLGPAAMGLCRMLNVLLGMSAVEVSLTAEYWLAAGGIGVYVAGLTWFARNETESEQDSTRFHLAAGATVMILGLSMLALFANWSKRLIPQLMHTPRNWPLLIGALGAMILWRCLWAIVQPSPRVVRRAVTHCIISIIMLDAAVCCAVRGLSWSGLILSLLIPTLLLRRKITMT